VDLVEDILEDEFEKSFASKDKPTGAPLDLLAVPLEATHGKTFPSKSHAQPICLSESSTESPLCPASQNEQLAWHLTESARESINQVDRQAMIDQTVEVLATATQVYKDLTESATTVGKTIDDVFRMMLQWEFLMLAWKLIERDIGAVPEASELEAPVPRLPEKSNREYGYLEAIESATISGKFDVTTINHRTPRVLHLKFRGEESLSIPLDEE
jgi:hypothetical protein